MATGVTVYRAEKKQKNALHCCSIDSINSSVLLVRVKHAGDFLTSWFYYGLADALYRCRFSVWPCRYFVVVLADFPYDPCRFPFELANFPLTVRFFYGRADFLMTFANCVMIFPISLWPCQSPYGPADFLLIAVCWWLIGLWPWGDFFFCLERSGGWCNKREGFHCRTKLFPYPPPTNALSWSFCRHGCRESKHLYKLRNIVYGYPRHLV